MFRNMKTIEGCKLNSKTGEIGKIRGFYFDDRDWAVRYVVADTGTWLPGRLVLLSPQTFGKPAEDGQEISVGLTKEEVESSPGIGKEIPVSRQHEAALSAYYGWQPYWGMGVEPHAASGDGPGEEREAPAANNPNLRSANELMGYAVKTVNGEKGGHVEDFIVDDEWTIKYMIVDTRNWFPGGKKLLVSPEHIGRFDFDEAACVLELTEEALEKCPEYSGKVPEAARA